MRKTIYPLVFLLFNIFISSCSQPLEKTTIIPTPVSTHLGKELYDFKKTSTISINDPSLIPAAEYLKSIFKEHIDFVIEKGNEKADVVLKKTNNNQKEGSYSLDIKKNKINIESSSYYGIIHAISTIRQLLPVEVESQSSNIKITLPTISINDEPRLAWRGIMLDSSRHFWTIKEVEKLLDLMALYKLNKFHWHLTDDQGWRIEIKKYPLLTENGAWRKLNEQDYGCIKQAKVTYQDDYLLPDDRIKTINGDTIYGGFYTQEQIKNTINYATQRGIEIIPEIDMPGHFLAAIEQYPYIGCDGLIGWGSFFSSPICVGKDGTIDFCKDILKEVFELFPSQYIHIGGDEVDKTNWNKCQDCQKRIKEKELTSAEELQAWFLREIESFSLSQGKRVIGWDEIMSDGLSDKSIIMWWRENNPSAIPTATSVGQNAINSCNTNLYFDYDQTSETLKNLLEYRPILTNLPEKQQNLILGVQANIWTEWIASFKHLEYMLVPRIFALSEIAWSEPNLVPSITEFQDKIQSHFNRMDLLNINYRVPDIEKFYHINSFVNDTIIRLYSPLKSAEIRYTTDDSLPTEKSSLLQDSITLTNSTNFTFRTYRKNGTASDIYKTQYIKLNYYDPIEPEITGNGLNLRWYNYKGDTCYDIDKASLVKTFVVDSVFIPSEAAIPDGKPGNIGFIYDGYIDIPSTGIYTFSLLSDDGSTLKIHDKIFIDNDGSHYPTEIIAQVPLKKGLHPIEIRYFDIDGGTISFYKLGEGDKREIVNNQWFKY